MTTFRTTWMRAAAAASMSAVLFLATGCAATAGPTQSPSPTPKVYVTAPLTGMQFEEGTNAALAGSSVACKIDNLDVARPQLGLNSADIVFDELVEGGLTRLVAVFHSKMPNAVGPVRSIRPMDPDIIAPLGGIVCYSGGQLKFVQMMQATNVFNANETEEQNKGTFSRDPNREAPHNVIVDIAKLQGSHPELTPPTKQFLFAIEENDANGINVPYMGTSVDMLKIYYPSALAQWTPSADRSVWLRTQDGKPHTDAADGSQISATNVVVLQVAIDRQYGHVPKTVMVSSGIAWVFVAGEYIKATWSKASQTAPIVLKDDLDRNVLLNPGNTWVELMPKAPEGSIKIVETPKPKPSPSATKK